MQQLPHFLKPEVFTKIESRNLSLEDLLDMETGEINDLLRVNVGSKVSCAVEQVPTSPSSYWSLRSNEQPT